MPSETSDLTRPVIKIAPRGPYLVSGVETRLDADGRPRGAEPNMALCRCGHSASKPLCDGTHVPCGFTGELRADFPAKRDYVGRDVAVHYTRAICAHVGICTARLGAVFNASSKPWIQPNAARGDDVLEAIEACPSGALSSTIRGPRSAHPSPTLVSVLKNGPLAVTGVELTGARWADGATPDRYTLCRCGESRSMPFCDGTHASIGFRDDTARTTGTRQRPTQTTS